MEMLGPRNVTSRLEIRLKTDWKALKIQLNRDYLQGIDETPSNNVGNVYLRTTNDAFERRTLNRLNSVF